MSGALFSGCLKSRLVSFCLAGLIALFVGGRLVGATRTWDGGANDGLWSSQNNWSSNQLPGATDSATFASSFGTGGTAISLNGNQTTVNLTFSTTTSFSIDNNTLTINGTTSAINRSAVSGTTTLNSALSIGASQTWTVASGGTLVVAGNVADNGNALTIASAGSTTISGVIGGGAGTLTKTGAGTLTLTGANSYTGATTISVGIVNIQNATALGTTAGDVSVASGAELQIQGAITVGTGEDLTSIAGVGTGTSGALRNISEANTWNGSITLGGATTIGSDAGTLTLAGSIVNGANTLTVTGAGNTTISGVIGSGSGGLTKTGAGTLTLTGANTYTGVTTINQGSLLLGADNVIGGGGSGVAMGGGTLNTQGRDNSGIGAMSLANTSYLDMAGGNIFGTDNSVINFADSSAASWNGASTLYILNWTGIDTVGHGTENVDQVYFGTSAAGLTSAQIGQIVFVNPYLNSVGSPYVGNVQAIILASGEVVPDPVPETRTVVFVALLGCVGLVRERRRLRAIWSGLFR